MVGHCSYQIPQQPENEQQPLSIRWREIHHMHCPEAGVQSSSQSQSKERLRNDAQISVSPLSVAEVFVNIQPQIKGVIAPLQLRVPDSGPPPKATKASKKWPWLISLGFGTPLDGKLICYSIHSVPKSLTFSSSTACQITVLPLLTPGNFSACFWPEFPYQHSFGVGSFAGFLPYKEFCTNALSLVISPYRLNLQPQICEWVNPASQDISLYFNVWMIPKGV